MPTLSLKNRVVWVLLLAALVYEVTRSSPLLLKVEDGVAGLSLSSPSFLVTQPSAEGANSFLNSWEKNTVVVSISFGNATTTNLLERLVYSLRTNGKWQGPMVILTDQAKQYQDRFQILSPVVLLPNTHIIQAKPEHLHPMDPKTGKPLEFVTEAMRFKRFKTLILDYLDEYYHVPFEHVLYLDVEIVVARPLIGLLQDYRDQMVQRQVFGTDGTIIIAPVNTTTTTTNTTTTLSFMSHFGDCPKCGRQNFHLNGGVFVLHHQYSRDCLGEWQSLFAQGATYARADQRYLVVKYGDSKGL